MQVSSNSVIAPQFSSHARQSERIDEALERAPLEAVNRETARVRDGKIQFSCSASVPQC
jgi:hypothetical protein